MNPEGVLQERDPGFFQEARALKIQAQEAVLSR